LSIVGTVLSIFLLLFTGYAMKKGRILKSGDAELLNTIVLYLALPAFIFEAIYSYRGTISLGIAKVPVFGFLTMCVVMAIAYGIGRALRLDRRILGGLILVSAFGNTGFLGYPVVEAAFRSKFALVTAVMYDELAMAFPLYTLGLVMATIFSGEKISREYMMKVFKLPSMWAIPLALILRPFVLPQPIAQAIHYLSNGTIPLVMISLGLSLSATTLKGYAVPVLAACVLKLAVLPLLTCLVMPMVGVHGTMHQVTVLESAMPAAMMSGVIAGRFGDCGEYATSAIFAGTLLGLVTIPLTLMILGVG
jgi:predicted permease